MMPYCREPYLPVLLLGCFAHTVQPAWPAFPARCPALVRLSRVLLGQWGLRLRRVTAHSHLFAHRILSFRVAGHRRRPGSAISELNTQPAYSPVQRFKCGLSTALAWLGARVVCYAFLCMTLSFTTPRRFIPTLSRLEARSTLPCVPVRLYCSLFALKPS